MVEATAVALVVMHVLRTDSWSTGLSGFIALCLIGVAHTEIAVGVERMRRRVTEAPHVDLSSVWTFAGAVLLPPVYAVLTALVVHSHLWWRAWRPRVPVYRQLFSTATVVLACIAASAVMHSVGPGGPAGVVRGGAAELAALGLALLVYTTVNSGLIAGAIAVSTSRPTAAQVLGHWDENMLEIATLCLGALTAVALAINPWLVVLVLPPLLVLHRAVLVRQLEEAASTDSKTGLLNAATWHTQAEREIRRAARQGSSAAVLILDLDHFKAVNDRHGHLAGDRVLSAVAEALRTEVRDNDLVGRFGGEEFVVLLPGLDGGATGRDELHVVAERIRHRVARLTVNIPTPDGPLTVTGLSVSVGGARFPGDGADLTGVMAVADTALYEAKRAGRNLVRMGLHMPPAEPLRRTGTEPPAPSS
ncbi:GGDEF domain-containing protein [Pseudonocardia bannensis]|uniref:GGDEF domain-containing protein n=1 Tax=Pseudonocardia bannensis TaxID=630973 RepID=A0A848DLK8_9PSEU|nr:GGDEF domain-containing protein [Pseudonocardia bannensis]NMH93637.1 GGDEF domain-containing protein [Pseudonocardia bannensis]